jgi:hypothetical protein
MDRARRSFLKNQFLGRAVKLIEDVTTSFKEAASDSDYFDSYETCYPLISEYSYFLDDEVKELGIETSGKSKKELVEAVYGKKGHIL